MSGSGQSVRSLIEGLPPEIAKRVHPDWQKNEAEYWAQRDTLLRQYADQWIGFAEGRVIASGMSPVEVFHAAQASGKHPFVTRVGHEHEPNRMRFTSLSFDSSVVSQKFAKEVGGLPTRHARESGHPDAFDFPGFRVAPAIAGSPGMTI
jgi:hypothetical protein